MKIKICGLFRDEDIEYVNEARPDFIGFVFAPSKRQVPPATAGRLKSRIAEGISTVGVFVNAPVEDIAALYRDGIIDFAQLHGNEDAAYIARLREAAARTEGRGNSAGEPLPIIKVFRSAELERAPRDKAANVAHNVVSHNAISHNGAMDVAPDANYYLIDSGAGSGKTFDWNILRPPAPCAEWLRASGKPWFLAGGITLDNIKAAMACNPFCVDISGGAETGGIKDREKIVRLTTITRGGNHAGGNFAGDKIVDGKITEGSTT